MQLVIGIGNRIRQDDGIGPLLVESMKRSIGVEAIAVHQLTPELAERLGRAQRVLFVDASLVGDDISLDRIEPSEPTGLGHSLDPSGLLALTEKLYGEAPEGWALSIPGSSFGLGEGLSDHAESLLPKAKALLETWLDEGAKEGIDG